MNWKDVKFKFMLWRRRTGCYPGMWDYFWARNLGWIIVALVVVVASATMFFLR